MFGGQHKDKSQSQLTSPLSTDDKWKGKMHINTYSFTNQ